MSPKLRLYVLFLTGGILMGLSWPFTGSLTPLMFIAWVPMLITEWQVTVKKWRPRKIFFPAYLGFIAFNSITSWWIYYATGGGMVMAIFVNGFLMTMFFYFFHLVHRRLGHMLGYCSFVTLWMALEYCHYHWEVSWPWLNLGNVFSVRTTWVQWYEYTGSGGGTVWVLLVNLLAFFTWQQYRTIGLRAKPVIKKCIAIVAAIVIPILISLGIYTSYEEKKDPLDVVVVQPNIDPYIDKFRGMNAEDQLSIFFKNAFMAADTTADFIVGPETVLPYDILEDSIQRQLDMPSPPDYFASEMDYIKRIFGIMKHTEIVLGMSSVKLFPDNDKAPANARPAGPGVVSVDYNSSFYIEPGLTFSIYHKKFLVLGVEKIPFASIIPAMNKWALSMGGSARTLGAADEPIVTPSKFTKAKFTTAICYESVYGGHLAHAVRKGANVIFVMTNDGWWRDTPGYKQHFSYARLRAIELRRSVARSANTGISGFIDQRGQIIKSTRWWTSTALRAKINLNNDLTLYARTGDLLYLFCFYLALATMVYYLYMYLFGKYATSQREV